MNVKRHERQGAPKPRWLKRRIPPGTTYQQIQRLLEKSRLHTVCQEALCPNLWECFSKRTATFLILGDRCTRACQFCAVSHGQPDVPDPEEPDKVARAAKRMELRYVVVTSVTRDDLPDGGAGHFARTIRAIREKTSHAKVEVLVPDFLGNRNALKTVIDANPDVVNHNIETESRLYPSVRPGAVYSRSIGLLKRAKELDPSIPTKSGLMLGLGETPEGIRQTFRDLLVAGCRILTLGQYLQPSKDHLPVYRFIPPEEFDIWRETALQMGFEEVASGPFVRSSYHARELFQTFSGHFTPESSR
jgi:lipoic acid synthetase